ncbi:MAG: hypothetical protein MNPFHGCM_00285 [Gemmatimonadaceae bacterium]|nr:hypothetical protein [Gemmatimonadaceae bacterium]
MTPLRWLLTILSFATSFGASIYVVVSGWPEDGAPLGLPFWAHLGALAIVAADLTLRTFKVQLSGRAVGAIVEFGTALRMGLGGDFAAAITPSKTGAEPARFLVLKEAGYPAAQILAVLFLELALELMSLLTIAVVFYLTLERSGSLMTALLSIVGAYATTMLAITAVLFILSRRNTSGPAPAWATRLRLSATMWHRVQTTLRHVKVSVEGLVRARPAFILAAYFVSVTHVFARLLVLPILVFAYGDRPPVAPLLVWPMVLLYGSSAAPAPAGGGVVEMSFQAALAGHIPVQLIASSLIWWRVYTFYAYVAFGAMSAGRTVMRALRPGAVTMEPDANEFDDPAGTP